MRRTLHPRWLGRRAYEPVHALMQELLEARQRGQAPDTVLFVEHEPVITKGRGAVDGHVLLPEEALRARGVDVVDTGRGGDVTLHAPGQLVCYPILDLSPERRDVRRYVADLTEVMRQLAAGFGIAGGPMPELIGLWTDRQNPSHWNGHESAADLAKLGAIGVRLSRWVTMHGFAFNLTTDLSLYGLIVPCGIANHGVTSVEALTAACPSVRETVEPALDALCRVLEADRLDLADESSSGDSAD